MATIVETDSRSFGEFLLMPNLTRKEHSPENVDLSVDLIRYKKGATEGRFRLKAPLVSAVMQAVTGPDLAIALAKEGGIGFIFHSQPIEAQVEMIRKVKNYKAGFVPSGANLAPDASMADAIALQEKVGHSTIAITEGGKADGVFVGILGSNDYPPDSFGREERVTRYATPKEKLLCGTSGMSLEDAYKMMWEGKQRVLPVLTTEGRLQSLVFRRDYKEHVTKKLQVVDADGRLMVGAGINTRDYRERVPALVEAGADVLCIDSSDGYSEWIADTLTWVRDTYGDAVKVGAGNIVDGRAFDYLVEAGADFVKVGVGPGSICITRHQKGIGRGQASAVIDVAAARDAYCERSGIYVPICADGGIATEYEKTVALALGADFMMLGRYFAGFDESPSDKVMISGTYYKEYWAEGSNRASNWARYDVGGTSSGLSFEEGIDGYVPYAGHLAAGVQLTLAKIRSTFCNCGALTVEDFSQSARLVAVSSVSLQQGNYHSVLAKDNISQHG